MPTTVEYPLNKTQNEEFVLPCQTCAGKTSHKALATVDVRGSEGDGGYSFGRTIDNQIVQCLGCKSIFFRAAEHAYPRRFWR
jgi:hypothetical protein